LVSTVWHGRTVAALEAAGVSVNKLFKVQEGRPNVLDMLINNQIAMVINIPSGKMARADEVRIRTTALYRNVPVMTTLAGARAAANGISELKKNGYGVRPLQSYHPPAAAAVRQSGEKTPGSRLA